MTGNDRLRWTRVPIAVVAGALLMVCASAMNLLAATGSVQDRSVWEGAYTDAQATRGEKVFIRACAECHSHALAETVGDGTAPSLIGEDFSFRWMGSSLAYLFDTIRQTMPEAAPNSLDPREYAAVTAYLLKLNKYPAGAAELDHTARKKLEHIFIDEGPPAD